MAVVASVAVPPDARVEVVDPDPGVDPADAVDEDRGRWPAATGSASIGAQSVGCHLDVGAHLGHCLDGGVDLDLVRSRDPSRRPRTSCRRIRSIVSAPRPVATSPAVATDLEPHRDPFGQRGDVGDHADHPVALGQVLQRRGDDLQGVGVQSAEALVEEDRVQRGPAARRPASTAARDSASANARLAWNVSPPDRVCTERAESASAWSMTKNSPDRGSARTGRPTAAAGRPRRRPPGCRGRRRPTTAGNRFADIISCQLTGHLLGLDVAVDLAAALRRPLLCVVDSAVAARARSTVLHVGGDPPTPSCRVGGDVGSLTARRSVDRVLRPARLGTRERASTGRVRPRQLGAAVSSSSALRGCRPAHEVSAVQAPGRSPVVHGRGAERRPAASRTRCSACARGHCRPARRSRALGLLPSARGRHLGSVRAAAASCQPAVLASSARAAAAVGPVGQLPIEVGPGRARRSRTRLTVGRGGGREGLGARRCRRRRPCERSAGSAEVGSGGGQRRPSGDEVLGCSRSVGRAVGPGGSVGQAAARPTDSIGGAPRAASDRGRVPAGPTPRGGRSRVRVVLGVSVALHGRPRSRSTAASRLVSAPRTERARSVSAARSCAGSRSSPAGCPGEIGQQRASAR